MQRDERNRLRQAQICVVCVIERQNGPRDTRNGAKPTMPRTGTGGIEIEETKPKTTEKGVMNIAKDTQRERESLTGTQHATYI